jgi:hypothetical protein
VWVHKTASTAGKILSELNYSRCVFGWFTLCNYKLKDYLS